MARAHWILIHPGTVSCAPHGSLLTRPLVFGWFDSYWTYWGSFLLVPPPFPIPLPVLIPHVAASTFCVFSTLPLATLSDLPVAPFSCPVHRLLLPVLTLPARSVLCALSGALWVCFFLLFFLAACPPLCLCASCPVDSCPCCVCFFYPPPCLHARHQCTGHRVTAPVLVSGPLALAGRASWRSLAKPDERPSVASLSPLPSLLSPPRPSRVACLSPDVLLPLSCSVCSPLLLRTPGLYLARPHSLSSLMVGQGGRYGSMRVIGMASLCAPCGAPMCRCWPPASPSPCAAVPVGFACFFPCLPLVLRSLLLTRAPRESPAPLCATPALPLLGGASPAPFCLYCPPSLPLLFIHPSIPLVRSTYALPLCPYPFSCSPVMPSP